MKKQIITAIITIIGFLASIISIFTFITGYQTLSSVFSSGGGSQESDKVSDDNLRTDGLKVTNSFSGSTVYYIQNGQEYQVMQTSRRLTETQISPDKSKVVGIAYGAVYISNYDGTKFHEYPICNLGGCDWFYDKEYLKNLVFISNNTIRIFIELEIDDQPDVITLGSFPINYGIGEYELVFDEYNSIVSVKKR